MKIRVALEWFLNPDHLPFIVGISKGWYKEAGLDVELIEPKEHYDGFEALKKGEVEIVVNEPIHLFEHYFKELRSLGCFFETRGGVMMKKEALPKLLNGEKIRITTPASNDVTNRVGFEILDRYAKAQGVSKDLVVDFIETDFYHIKNLKTDVFDGAWLCFDNFEGVEAEFESLDVELIDTDKSNYPNFSALEVMIKDDIYKNNKENIKNFIEVTTKSCQYIQENVDAVIDLYYKYSREDRGVLMDEIVKRSIGYIEKSVVVNPSRWYKLKEFLNELRITEITEEMYEGIWIK